MLGGLVGYRLDLHVGMSSYFSDEQYFSDYSSAVITGLHGDVVALWSTTAQAWDTLFWMGAVPGDEFYRPFADEQPCDPADHFLVTDTTSIMVDGMSLRRWWVAPVWNGDEYGPLYFTERLGWASSMIPFPACMVVDGPTGLRCYSDEDIAASFFPYGCTTLVGLDEDVGTEQLALFPNPGSDQFTLSLAAGTHTITLRDATGRMMGQQRTSDEQTVINTSDLPPGIYLVSVDEGSVHLRWVKE